MEQFDNGTSSCLSGNAESGGNRGRMKAKLMSTTWMDFPSAVPNILPIASPFKEIPSSSSRERGVSGLSCPTGWPSFDGMLDGAGLPSFAVIEITGLSGSGKTQLCLSSAISAAWIGKKVLYIDSGNGMTALRLDQLVALRLSRGSNSNTHAGTAKEERLEVLRRVDVCASYDPWDLLNILTIAKDLNERPSNGNEVQPSYLRKSSDPYYDLIIIDSLHNIFNPYFGLSASEPKTNTGKSISIDPLISSIGVCLKSLGSNGSTILATNQTSSSGQVLPRACTSALSDIFDIILSLTARTVELYVSTGAPIGSSGLDTLIVADVVTRPPYYNMNPTRCQTLISDLCAPVHTEYSAP